MELDHIAYRVNDRNKTAKFFCEALGYSIADEFEINFDNGEVAKCFALSKPGCHEIFVSDGSPKSIVGKWVSDRGGVGGVHHIAYKVSNVEETMKLWVDNNWAEFTTDRPISNSNDLVQCFTKPHELTGIIYEFIKRGSDNKGFNVNNVLDLMKSTEEL